MYLERPAHAEDAVVGLLGCQTLHGALHDLALFGDKVIGPVDLVSPLLHPCAIFKPQWHPPPYPDLPYLRPSFLYPALSKYHLLSGWAQRISQGRFMMYGASEGCDMAAVMCGCGGRVDAG